MTHSIQQIRPVFLRIGAAALMVLFLLLVTALSALAQDNPFARGWVLDPTASSLRFQSVKNETKVESSSFATLSGGITEDGTANVRVLLDSVDTKIDLRNVRMRFLFFETFQFPEAIISARINTADLTDLGQTRRKTMSLPYTLDLHGVKKEFTADVFVTLLDDDKVAVSTGAPIAVAAEDFALTEGITKLQDAAGVRIIPSATVTFDFVFNRNTGAGAPVLAAEPAKPGAAALEAKGDFDLEACVGRFEILSRSGNIYFAPGSARLDRQSNAILESIVDIVSRCPGLVIEVSGHTDSIGDEASNQRLSEARAQSVAQYLTGKGIEPARFRAVGYGELKPVAPNDTNQGRGRNRRIEFAVVNNG